MTCANSEILLHALLDGELDAGHARDVETHLEGCLRCATQLRAYREMQQAMSAAATQLRYTAPMSLRRRIEMALPSAPPRATNRRSMLKGFAMSTGALNCDRGHRGNKGRVARSIRQKPLPASAHGE